MAGTLDYLRWRGDLSFKERPFNSVDASLFASIIYLPVDKSAKEHTLSEVAEKLHVLPSFQVQMKDLAGDQILLLPKSPRLGDIKILNWTNRLEKDPYYHRLPRNRQLNHRLERRHEYELHAQSLWSRCCCQLSQRNGCRLSP